MNIVEIGETPRNPMTNLENSGKIMKSAENRKSGEKSGKSRYFGGNSGTSYIY